MNIEIERKFLLKTVDWRKTVGSSLKIQQGYLNSNINRTVRVRLVGDKGVLTIKGKTVKNSRPEFEYDIPKEEAMALLDLCEKPIIEKIRHLVSLHGNTWEIDEFFGDNKGLIVAEIELETEDQKIVLPDWLGQEVSDEPKYFNSALIQNPYKNW